jgi:hypothetical protein
MNPALLLALALPLPPQEPCGAWSPGFEVPGVDDRITASAVFDDGTGPALYVAGHFQAAGTVRASQIARWDGTSWSGVGGGIGTNYGEVHSLVVHDDGTGDALYAGGEIVAAGGQPASAVVRWDGIQPGTVAVVEHGRWNGTAWEDVGGGVFAGQGTVGVRSSSGTPAGRRVS